MSQKQTFGSTNTGIGFGFGATANTSTTSGLNDSIPSTSSGLFGQQNTSIDEEFCSNATGGYGQQMATGTAVVKYNPVADRDVVVKAGNSTSVNVKHHCITCMKEYESKSLEELRLDDYVHYKENKPLFGGTTGFGFGATANTSTTSGLNDSIPSTSSGLFGQQNTSIDEEFCSNATGGYGQQMATGTAVVKYNPVVDRDVVVKAGNSTSVNVKHHCITCMKEYESKSLEELRLDDYVHYKENKPLFGGTTGTGLSASFQPKPTNPVLGTLGTTGSLFQQPAQNTVKTDTISFGSDKQTNKKSMGLFGANKPGLGATSTPGKGFLSAATTQASAFGTNTTTFRFEANTKNQTVGLYTNELAASTGFGSFSSELFTKTKTTASTFATTTLGTGLSASFQPKPTDPVLGTLGTTGSLFQQPAQNTVKTDTISFGGDTQTNTKSLGLFGANKPGLGATSTPGKGFLSATTTQAPAFGTNTTTFRFGTNTQNQTVGLYTNELAASTGFGSFSSERFTKTKTTASTFATTTLGTGLSASFQPKPTDPVLGTLGTTGSLFQQPAQNTVKTDTISFGGDTQTNTKSLGLFGANKPGLGATSTPGKGFLSATTTQAPAFGTNTTTFRFGTNTQNQTVGLYTNELAASTGFGSFSSERFTKTKTTASTFATTTLGTGLSASFQPKPTDPVLGTLGTTGSLFQQPAQNTVKTDTISFGGDTQTNTKSLGLFGANKPGLGATSTPGKGFLSATTTQAPAFGTNTTTFRFGTNTQNQTVGLYTNELAASTGFGSFSSERFTKTKTTASTFATTTLGTGLSASFQPKPTDPVLGTLQTTGSLFQQPAQNTVKTDTISFGGDTQTNTKSLGLFGANKPGLGAMSTPGKAFLSATTTQASAFGTNTTTFRFGTNTQNQTVGLYTNELAASTGFGSFSSERFTKTKTTASTFATTTLGTGLSASFQPKPTNPGLGTLETTGSLFQQPAQNTVKTGKGYFSATTTQAPAFGTNTTTFGFGSNTQKQTVGLYTNEPAASTGFGSFSSELFTKTKTTASNFATTTLGTGLSTSFQPKPTKPGLGTLGTTGSLFQQPAQNTVKTDTISFGGDTQTNTKSMGLFGDNKPGLGATSTPGKGYFSATSTQAPAVGTNTTTFGFGANAQNQTVGLYSNELVARKGFGSFCSERFTKTKTTASTIATTTPGTGLSTSFQPETTNPGFGTLETTGSLFQQPAQNTVRALIGIEKISYIKLVESVQTYSEVQVQTLVPEERPCEEYDLPDAPTTSDEVLQPTKPLAVLDSHRVSSATRLELTDRPVPHKHDKKSLCDDLEESEAILEKITLLEAKLEETRVETRRAGDAARYTTD